MSSEVEKSLFCGILCPYRLSAIIIGVIESITLLIYLISSIFVYVESKITANCVYTIGNVQYSNKCNGYRIYRYLTTHPLAYLLISCTVCPIGWLSVGLMLWGLRSVRPRLLLVHLTAETLAAFAIAGAVVLFSVRAASVAIEESTRAAADSLYDLDMHHVDPILTEALTVDLTLVVLLVIIWIVNMYFLVIIYKCYHYLKDLRWRAQLLNLTALEMSERTSGRIERRVNS